MTSCDEKGTPSRFNEEAFNYSGNNYKDIKKIKVSRMILDDAENLVNVYTSLEPQKYIATLAQLCLSKEITLGIVNTRSKDETSEVDKVCMAVSDNAFKFDKYFFKGELFTTFNIIRSSTNFHNNMMYYLSKRDDGLLQLKNTFALLSNVEKQNPEPLEVRLFLPDLSKEFSKYMYRLLIERDMFMLSHATIEGYEKDKKEEKKEDNETKSRWKRHFAKRFDFSSQIKIIDPGGERLETFYNPQEQFPSNFKDWHDFLKDMITYSLAHPNVEIFTANNPFTDISIILEDESAKDAITILCLPGYLMDLYEKNLASISDYVHFPGSEPYVPVNVKLEYDDKWVSFQKKDGKSNVLENSDENGKIKFGNEFYYLKKAAFHIPEGNVEKKDGAKNNWIIPEIIFNPIIARYEETNKVIKKSYKNSNYIEIKGYPYYLDSRVDLVFGKGKPGENEQRYFIHDTVHDFVALFFELWFGQFKTHTKDCHKRNKIKGERSCKEECLFCFFHRASKEDIKNLVDEKGEPKKDITNHIKEQILYETVEDFVNYIDESVEFDQEGLIDKLMKLKNLEHNESSRIVLREWYSSAHLKLQALEPFLLSEKINVEIRLEIPECFLYTTWYLAVPVNSPRKETASEFIIKMTDPHDLAYLQISGIGLQLSEQFYSKAIYKSFPDYRYSDVHQAMKELVEGKPQRDKISGSNGKKLGVPIASIHCYFEQLTPFGGMLRDIYRKFNNLQNPLDKKEKITKNKEIITKELFTKIIAFSETFKAWQKDEKKRCKSCYMTHLFCEYSKRYKKDNKNKSQARSENKKRPVKQNKTSK
jgi:hypothetical protein